jgi:hypothetical protein
MTRAKAMYAWTAIDRDDYATAGQVKVGPHPDTVGWTKPYASALGPSASHNYSLIFILSLFATA